MGGVSEQKHMFKTGDVVTLKSGGPQMTVRNHITGDRAMNDGWPEYVMCDWIDAAGISHCQKFHPDQLEPSLRVRVTEAPLRYQKPALDVYGRGGWSA